MENIKTSPDEFKKSFSYKSVDFSKVRRVEMVTPDDRDYQEFLTKLASKTRRERQEIIEENREKFNIFKDIAELLVEKPFILKNHFESFTIREEVCKYCQHSSKDKYSDAINDYVCWFDYHSGKPPRVDAHHKCNNFTLAEYKVFRETAEKIAAHHNLPVEDVRRVLYKIDDEPRRAILEWAWLVSGLYKIHRFHIGRVEAFLRDLESSIARSSRETNITASAIEYEDEIKRVITSHFSQIDRKIFKIKYHDGKISFKVPDLIVTHEDHYCIIEIYSWKPDEDKEKQLRDYGKLFAMATGEIPGLVLIGQDWDWVIEEGKEYHSYHYPVLKPLNEIGENFSILIEEIMKRG